MKRACSSCGERLRRMRFIPADGPGPDLDRAGACGTTCSSTPKAAAGSAAHRPVEVGVVMLACTMVPLASATRNDSAPDHFECQRRARCTRSHPLAQTTTPPQAPVGTCQPVRFIAPLNWSKLVPGSTCTRSAAASSTTPFISLKSTTMPLLRNTGGAGACSARRPIRRKTGLPPGTPERRFRRR